MKYGDTLQQRSIPLWESYNVDYNDIKHLIKIRTTHDQGQAKDIPGRNNEAKKLQVFEDELYGELCEQYQRVDLFVKSKSGEIGRRLSHLDKQITQLKIRSFSSGRSKLSVRRLETFSKIELATIKAGEEIQSLSRFVGAQRLAFQKLLKKYRKWTGSPDLGKRFREGLLDRPTSFSKRDLQPLLVQWTEVLASVRAPFDGNADWTTASLKAAGKSFTSGEGRDETSQSGPSDAVKAQSSAEELHAACECGSNVDIDTALATVPLGSDAARAIYWIHPDNIVQIHVLMLQETRLRKRKVSSPTLNTPPSSRSSPRSSLSANTSRPSYRNDEEVGVIVCDDLESFARRQNSKTISEEKPGSVAEQAAASIRYCCSGDANLVVGSSAQNNSSLPQSGTRLPASKAKVEYKTVSRLFDVSKADRPVHGKSSEDSEQVCKWLCDHDKVQPLVQLQSRRTRFVGLRNNDMGGIWATLDTDVRILRSSKESVAEAQGFLTIMEAEKHNSVPFPHAILEVRIEGDVGSDLISRLDASHLTERVRGFSLETHAVATLCKPQGMSRPFWLPALGQDIRKLPAATQSTKRQVSQGHSSPEQPSTRRTSISVPSTPNGPSGSGFSGRLGESSATSAPDLAEPPVPSAFKKKRRRSHRRKILDKGPGDSNRKSRPRYWNEFDDGSEGSDNEAYTIFIDPNTPSTFPGLVPISRLFTTLVSKCNIAENKMISWFSNKRPQEQEPLMNGSHSPSLDDSDASDAESPLTKPHTNAQRRYSTFPAPHQSPAVRARETLLFRSCLASFAAASVLLLVAAILKTTGRRKAETTVDAGVIIGVASSLVFGIIAVGSMVGRKDDVGWVHRLSVFLLFALVAAGGGGLIASLGWM